ncbi:hypothetical protein EYF80_038433 [Liparis tanakae]|uniref:Secreted protein n=1 Tax=Liparis tanakae TaxID=230148 RepID=A0A4Z2GDX2_9TELE|nr:hypothetical protein EYF80_038433 [Liparis tanakae]
MCVNSLELLLGLRCLPVGLAQLDLHLIEVSLHLLLQTESLVPAASLGFERALQGVDRPLQVPLGLLHLLVSLCELAIHVGFDLVELQLGSEDLALLVLQRTLRQASGTNILVDSLGLLQFLGSLDGISFVLGPPLSHLRVGLGHAALQLGLGLLLLLVLLPQQVAVVARGLHRFLLDPLQVVDLLSEVGHTVGLFLPECGGGGFVLQSGLFQVPTEFLELGLPLFVHLDLDGRRSAGLLQPLADLLQLSGQVCPLLFHLGSGSSLCLQLFLQLLYTSLLGLGLRQTVDFVFFTLQIIQRLLRILLGKPFLQILMPSSTPLQRSWCITRGFSMAPGVLVSLGMMQRTNRTNGARLTFGAIGLRLLLPLLLLELHVAMMHDGTDQPEPQDYSHL